MEYSKSLEKYAPALAPELVEQRVAAAREATPGNQNIEVYKLCYSTIDLTSLDAGDNAGQIRSLVRKTVEAQHNFPGVPGVASICVYPNFVEVVGLEAGDSGIRITSVGGGFPSSQTYLEVKMLEIAMAVENGADEIDIVLDLGRMLAGDYDQLAGEIELIRAEVGEETVLKVIIESGVLQTPELIRKASLLAMMAGADFVKTSTGKNGAGATPQAAVVMCRAIADYHRETGRKVGFKAAGGVRTAEDAALYYTIVEQELGAEWLDPSLFRIGASSAANNLLSAITGQRVEYY